MFGNKKITKKEGLKEDTLDLVEENNNKNEKINTSGESNIFEDFDIDSELGNEIKNIQIKLNKDRYFYLNYISNILKYFNLIIILIGTILFSYIAIQDNANLSNRSLLDPICNIILGKKIINDAGYCSSLAFINDKAKKDLSKLKKETFKDEIKILPGVYKKENFLNSKEIIFLLEKGESRLRPLDIISKFDDLKNKYEPLLKSKISCNNINITDKYIFTVSCYAYSTGWEGAGIIGFNGDPSGEETLQGTSISVASSFLNFLKKQNSELYLIGKQKIFSIESIFDTNSRYTKRTPFSVKMKYFPKK